MWVSRPPGSEHWMVIDRAGKPAGRTRWPNRVGGLIKQTRQQNRREYQMRLRFIVVVAVRLPVVLLAISNRPPFRILRRLRSFLRLDDLRLQRVSLDSPYAGQNANERATARIQEHFVSRVSPVIDGWNGAEKQGQPGRTLVIEPRIEHIKFIGGAARFWVARSPVVPR